MVWYELYVLFFYPLNQPYPAVTLEIYTLHDKLVRTQSCISWFSRYQDAGTGNSSDEVEVPITV